VGAIQTLSRRSDNQALQRFVPLGHVPALDGLRGVAILLVLGFHSGLVRGGWLGVDLFFVLSGFLITSLLLGEWAGRTISLRSFYRRRACRLLPALVAMVAVYLGVVLVFGDAAGRRASLESALLGLTYTMNIHNMLVGTGSPDPVINHLWSLATEEQFYLVWPPLLLLLLSRSVHGKKLLACVVGGAAIAAVGSHWTITYWDALLMGCAAGVLFTNGLVPHIPKLVWELALVVALWLALFMVEGPATNAPVVTVFALAGSIAVLAAATSPGSWLARVLGLQPLRYVGRISYGLYIWHHPLFALLGWRLGLPAAFATAILSFRYIEQPFLRRRTGRSPLGRVPRAIPSPALPETAAS
jgi:peptidoglycan/LPS O-acetylase OafA/YrhL